MSINVKKSCCIRIGPRCDAICANLTTANGNPLPWVDEIRYLGIYVVNSRKFKCSLDKAKRSCYRSLNAVFGKVGRCASEEVVLELVAKKCLPILVYGLEACPLTKSDVSSLDFVFIRFLMKLFKTGDIDCVKECCHYFNFRMSSEVVAARRDQFVSRHHNMYNFSCLLSSN